MDRSGCPVPRADFDHHSEGFAQDPWQVYAELREQRPVAWTEAHGGFWVVTRYEDVRQAALDAETFSSDMDDLLIPPQGGGWLLPVQADPPDVTRYRSVLSEYFSLRAVRELEPAVERFTNAALDEIRPSTEFDVVHALAHPIPGKVTTAMVGWPEEDWPDMVLPITHYSGHAPDDPRVGPATERILALRERIENEVAGNRRQPGSGMVADLVRADTDGRHHLSDAEIVALVMMVIFGGVDTTVRAIGNALEHLDTHPDLRRALIASPDQIPDAVDELLRIKAPVQGFARRVTRACELGGQRLAEGDTVFLAWASANRDPDEFTEPDDVDLNRGRPRHLTFGIGRHRCLGATLARVELGIVLRLVLERMPDYRILRERVVSCPSAGTANGRMSIPAVAGARLAP